MKYEAPTAWDIKKTPYVEVATEQVSSNKDSVTTSTSFV